MITFDMPMDSSVVPNKNNFRIVLDGTPFVPTAVNWDLYPELFTQLQFGFVPTIGLFQQVNLDINCRGLNGGLSVSPQEIQWFPENGFSVDNLWTPKPKP